jgi:PAS domain S-box-containing protein
MGVRTIRTVLVVDNNRIIVEMVTDFLEARGYDVEKAYDGMEALDKARRHLPDAVVLDLIMPRIDGMRVCRYLKGDPETAGSAVVILSGTAAEEQVDLSMIGADAFVAKRRFPEMMENLAEVLASFEGKTVRIPPTEVVGGESLAPRELVRELLDVKHHYDTLMDMVEDGVVEIDREERVLYVNRSALRYLEILEGDLIGKSASSFFGEKERVRFSDLLGKIATDPHASGSLSLDMPNKTLKLKVVPLYAAGSYDGALITLQDVTAEVQKTKGLEQLNRRIIENVPVGIALVGGNGFIKTLNPVMASWLGATDAAGISGANLFEFRKEPVRPVVNVIGKLFARPGLQTGEVTVKQDGAERVCRIIVSQELTAEDFRGRIVIVEDETERSQLRRRLERINEELLVANQTKSNFISMISHELRTPLTIVEGYLSLLLENSFGALQPKVREAIDITKEKSDHLHRLIEDLLDISRIEAGQFLVRMGEVDCAEILDQAVLSVRDKAASRGIVIGRSVPEGSVALLSEKSKVYQILVNLLGNAVKFSEPGGEISVAVSMPGTKDRPLPPEWRVVVQGPSDLTEYCDIEVRDNGIGVDPQLLPGLFEIFSQAESGPARMYTGSGIGLFIVREIVIHHRGRIIAWGAPGKGFAARISLPLDTATNRERFKKHLVKVSADDFAEAPVTGSPGVARVVLIDDDPDLGTLLAHILPPERFALEVFNDSVGGLERIGRGGVDLVLLDLKLPGMSGYDVCTTIRATPETAALPILLITASSRKEEIERGLKAGANGVVEKPFEPGELLRAVGRLLQDGAL